MVNRDILKQMYPKGTVIELIEMQDESGMPQGLRGTVFFVDDIGSIHVSWENGSNLALINGCDKFRIIDAPNLEIENDIEAEL